MAWSRGMEHEGGEGGGEVVKVEVGFNDVGRGRVGERSGGAGVVVGVR